MEIDGNSPYSYRVKPSATVRHRTWSRGVLWDPHLVNQPFDGIKTMYINPIKTMNDIIVDFTASTLW